MAAFTECVGAFLVRDARILLGKRSAERDTYPGVWDVFGGHVEAGESLQDALARELLEELGIRPTQVAALATVDVAADTAEGRGTTRCHFYVVTAWTGTPENRQPHEHVEVRWFDRAEARRLDLASPAYGEVIDRVCRSGEGA